MPSDVNQPIAAGVSEQQFSGISSPIVERCGSAWLEADAAWSPGRFALVLLLLICAAFPTVIAGSHTFFYRDFGLFGYPLAHYHRQNFWHGQIPLWNPYNNCGIPYVAQWNTLVLYPLSFIYLLLPLSSSLALFCLGHLFLGGLGMYFLAGRWTNSRLAGAVAGMGLAFSGLMLNCLMFPNDIAALGWAPWVIHATERAWLKGGRAVFLGALTGAMQMLTGAPEVILLTWVVIAVLHVAGLASAGGHKIDASRQQGGQPTHRVRSLLRFGAVVLLVAGICAAQLAPFLDLLVYSHRQGLVNSATWAMPRQGIANLMMPLFGMREGLFGVWLQPGQYWTSSYYLGIGTLLLAFLSAGLMRNGRVAALAVCAIFGIGMALGNEGFIYPALRAAVPQLSTMRYPIKFIVLTTLAVPLLAAHGVARWSPTPQLDKRPLKSAIWVAVGLALLLVGLSAVLLLQRPTPYTRTIVGYGASRLAFLAAVGAVLALAPRLANTKAATLCWACLPLIFGLDGLTHMPRQNPVAPRWMYEAGAVDQFLPSNPTPALGQCRAMVSPETDDKLEYSIIPDPAKNCLSRRTALFDNLNLLERMPKTDGMFSLYPRRTADVTFMLYRSNSYPERLADFLAVSQISARSNLFSWETRPTSLPLVTGGQKPVFADEKETLRHLVSPTFNPRAEVLLPLEAQASVGDLGPAEVVVQSLRQTPDKMDMYVTSTAKALVVIAQTDYHWWKCFIAEKPAEIIRANHAFQAVAGPPGRHRLSLSYRDRSFLLGSIVSLATVAVCATGCAMRQDPTRRSPTPPASRTDLGQAG
jgi:hypothetical protein